MSDAEQRLKALDITLPAPLKLPPGMVLPFPWVNVRGDRAFISGHGPQETDGAPAGPFGALGESVSVEEGYASARKVGLSMLGSLQRELGSLNRITGWCHVHGMINCNSGFSDTPSVLNGFTDLIIEVFGEEIGRHSRTAVGVAGLPINFPVEVEAEVMVSPA
ncbi:RidA family protein [Hoeflea prorocentri]|uniref:RidA family protein n=1 Tax=Hoeflea prorocentri TaxID=1922333 RepID=A0A9X3UK01_9HYPH|nr:RidA family protein [Hoeflea prorocentri]MCY6382742.1 RidA family protein [Hoeflea prorocentri]MDA5400542.1 RidA family protein [Hoeflea prorocentri]